MTAAEGRDPTLQAEIDRAVRELARRLRPIVTIRDVDGFAASYLEWLAAQGLHLMPRSDKIPQPGRRDPATARRGAGLARDLLNKRGETT